MNKPFFVFGSCAASQIALGLEKLRQQHPHLNLSPVGYWAMAADNFLNKESYGAAGEKLIISRPFTGVDNKRSFFSSGIDKGMDAWMYLPASLELPLQEDAFYIFASPVFPFSPFVSLIRDFEQYHPSHNMIEDIIKNALEPQLEFLDNLRTKTENLLVVEGPRLFRIDIDVSLYGALTKRYVDYAKNRLKELKIDILELPENDVLDKDGFTKSIFRQDENDCLHANMDYGVLMAKMLLKKLDIVT